MTLKKAAALAGLGCALCVTPAAAQQERAVRGQVRAVEDSVPLASVLVAIVRTGLATLTDDSGRFVIHGAPGGRLRIAVRWIGIAADTVVLAAERDTLTVYVRARAVILTPVVVVGERSAALERFETAGNLINPFAGDSGETVFRAGRAYLLSVSVTDSNYYDFIRSRSDPFTGRGFINHLEGGVGVFGSVETRTYVLRVVADVDDPREGVYRLQGRAGGADIDVTLELYLDDLQPGVFSAFVRGDWIGSEVRRSADGLFGDPDRAAGNDDAFTAEFRTRARLGVMAVFVMRGVRSARGTPFDVSLVGTDIQREVILTATLTATQISGPTGR